MKSKLLAVLLFAGSAVFAGPRVFVGVGFGYPAAPVAYYAPPPAPLAAYAPPCPGYGYTYIRGYWYPSGPRWAWRGGYWARPPYARAHWVGPRYYRSHYYGGYWRR